jgi:hypothetical protein
VRCDRGVCVFPPDRLCRLHETQSEIDSIRTLDCRISELLVPEGFRRLVYAVDNPDWYVPNSQVHIALQKDGEETLVE